MKAFLTALIVLLTASAAHANEGQAVFMKNGCVACHAVAGKGGKVGPALDGLGAKGAAFIKEAIVNPNSEITKGYAPNIMPQTYGKTIKPEDLEKLVAYLATL
jgi:cytochrome c551/c552